MAREDGRAHGALLRNSTRRSRADGAWGGRADGVRGWSRAWRAPTEFRTAVSRGWRAGVVAPMAWGGGRAHGALLRNSTRRSRGGGARGLSRQWRAGAARRGGRADGAGAVARMARSYSDGAGAGRARVGAGHARDTEHGATSRCNPAQATVERVLPCPLWAWAAARLARHRPESSGSHTSPGRGCPHPAPQPPPRYASCGRPSNSSAGPDRR